MVRISATFVGILIVSIMQCKVVYANDHIDRFGDWELICKVASASDDTSNSDNNCRLQQAQGVKNAGEVVFLVNIARQSGATVAIVSTPMNVYLPTGIDLKIDKGTAQKAVYETCNVSGCHAGFVIDKAMIAALRKGSNLLVTVSDTKKTKVPINVSLKGISQGLDALSAKETR